MSTPTPQAFTIDEMIKRCAGEMGRLDSIRHNLKRAHEAVAQHEREERQTAARINAMRRAITTGESYVEPAGE